LYVKYIEPIAQNYPAETIFKVEGMGDDNFGYRRFYTPPVGNKNGGYLQGKPTSSDITEKPYPNFFNYEADYNNVSDEGGVSFRNGKKPESLISFLLSIFTKERDLILDYHLGSGTTAAVAHKMGRRYIGLEQMDYIKELCVTRLQNVIAGEQSGISTSIGWNPKDPSLEDVALDRYSHNSFVYCELATANQRFVDAIEEATSTEQLKTIWAEIQATGFLSWKVKPQEIDENISDFTQLSLDDQKRFLIECLDKNLLYVPYSEINNKEFGISEVEKGLNSDFYSIG
jgi:adenine-specific DNA-methyltransferase